MAVKKPFKKKSTVLKKLKHGVTRVAVSAKRKVRARKAVKFMRTQHKKGTTKCPHGYGWQGHCAHSVACAYGKFASGWDAYEGWTLTNPRVRHTGRHKYNPPRGAICFYRGGQYGHVVISNGRGKVWGVDLPVTNRIGLVSVKTPEALWGQEYLGWVWPDEVAGWSF